MYWLQEILNALQIIKEIVFIGAAISGAFVAIIGLSTWRRQLRGSLEHETAINLFRSVLKLRDSIRKGRRPFTSSSESATAYHEKHGKYPDFLNRDQLKESGRLAQVNRWNEVVSKLEDLEVQQLECEVLWGPEIKNLLKPLFELSREINFAISDLFDFEDNIEKGPLAPEEQAERKRITSIIYDRSKSEDPDLIEKRIISACTDVEIFVFQYIRK